MRWIKWIKETNDQVNDWTGSLAKRVKWAELRSFEDARAYSRRQAQTNQLVVWHVFFLVMPHKMDAAHKQNKRKTTKNHQTSTVCTDRRSQTLCVRRSVRAISTFALNTFPPNSSARWVGAVQCHVVNAKIGQFFLIWWLRLSAATFYAN